MADELREVPPTFRELPAPIIPPEPARGSCVLDGEGAVWQRGTLRWAGAPVADTWMRAGVILPVFRLGALPEGVTNWPRLMTEHGTITLIFRAPEPTDAES